MLPPSFIIAVVDPTAEFAKRAEFELRDSFDKYDLDYDVIGYENASEFCRTLDKFPYRVPLVVVGDVAARTPSIEEGVLAVAHEKVPRSRGIYFTHSPSSPEALGLARLPWVADIVARGGTDDMKRLAECIRKVIRDFEDSVECALTRRFAENVRQTSNPETRFVTVNGDKLSWPGALVEMARGTRLGNRVFRELLPDIFSQDSVSRSRVPEGAVAESIIAQAKKQFSLMVLRGASIGILMLSAMGIAIGLHTGMVWEFILPSSFAALVFGLILGATFTIESRSEA